VRFFRTVIVFSLLATFCNASDQSKSTVARAATSVLQIAELTPPDGVNDGFFGQSVAISEDGNTIAVESFENAGGPGAIYVYEKPASGWQNPTLAAELTVTGGLTFLYAPIAMSQDGSTIVVNGFNATPYSQVFVFVKPSTGWTNMTQTAALHATHGGEFGFGNAIATDGDDVLVGATGCSGNGDFSSGSAYLFVKPASGWADMTQTAMLEETNPIDCDDYGSSVAIQGNTAVVGRSGGGMTPPVAPGAIYVFTKPASGWVTMGETAILSSSTEYVDSYLGDSVALSGNTILAPLSLSSQATNTVYIFTEPAGGWADATETATLTNTAKGVTSLGLSIAVSGSTAAVVAEYHGHGVYGYVGALTLYNEPVNGWQNASAPSTTAFPSDGTSSARFGFGNGSVAMGSGYIVVGSEDATGNGFTNEGAAYIFQQN
jgi:FG-GAP repeat